MIVRTATILSSTLMRRLIIALAANHAKRCRKRPSREQILLTRRLKKARTYFLAIPDFDGRMRTSIRITGRETGRTSTSSSNLLWTFR
jgi:hypothetical protein